MRRGGNAEFHGAIRAVPVACVLALAGAISGCAPVFSDLQDARMAGKGHVDLTSSFSTVSFTGDEGTDHLQDGVGIQAATGITNSVDLRVRYEYVWVSGDNGAKANVLGFGPKVSIMRNHIAAYLPVGFAFGGDVDNVGDTWEFHPTLLFTVAAARILEFTGSTKYIIPFSGDMDDLLAFNIGLGVSPDLERWAIRPEFGYMFDPGDSGGHFTHFSIGLSYKTK